MEEHSQAPADDAAAPPAPPPPPTRGRPKKTFKACRTCRRQKMRCEGQAPCARCRASGATCIFDAIGPQRSMQDRDAKGMQQQRARIEALEAEILRLRQQTPVAARAPSNHGLSAETHSTQLIQTPTESPLGHSQIASDSSPSGKAGLGPPPNPYALNPDDLDAPVTAIHAMTPETPRRLGGQDWDADPTCLLPSITPPKDFISDGQVDETLARELFNCFMTGSNVFLPMLDATLDTFDSLRVRSPFCFAVVLATAARAREATNPASKVRQVCQSEARRLAAETLFIGVPVLEDAQAMTLLAAFSERTWFAVGHATQMAVVLKLQNSLQQLLHSPHSASADGQKMARLLARQARTWLMVMFIEWEIAAGTARRPRVEAIDIGTLRAFASHPASNVSDSRIVSLLELVMLRARQGQVQKEIEDSENSLSAAMTEVRSSSARFDTWCTFWEKAAADSGYPPSSFQRTSLYVSREYAKTFTCCAALRKMQMVSSLESAATLGSASQDSVTLEILSYVMNVMFNQLSFLVQSPAYKWHLRWAPTYTALTTAFTCVLALKMSKLKPELIDQSRLQPLAKEVARLLQTHPHQNFHHVIRLLMSAPRNLNTTSNDQSRDSNLAGQEDPSAYHVPGTNMQFARASTQHLEQQPVDYPAMYPSSGDNLHVGAHQQAPDSSYRGWLGDWSNLESSWLLDGTSIGSFGLPNNGNASVFDFDLPSGFQDFQYE